jgi:hypothetical protein
MNREEALEFVSGRLQKMGDKELNDLPAELFLNIARHLTLVESAKLAGSSVAIAAKFIQIENPLFKIYLARDFDVADILPSLDPRTYYYALFQAAKITNLRIGIWYSRLRSTTLNDPPDVIVAVKNTRTPIKDAILKALVLSPPFLPTGVYTSSAHAPSVGARLARSEFHTFEVAARVIRTEEEAVTFNDAVDLMQVELEEMRYFKKVVVNLTSGETTVQD